MALARPGLGPFLLTSWGPRGEFGSSFAFIDAGQTFTGNKISCHLSNTERHVACFNFGGAGNGRLGIFPAEYAKPTFSH
jgi:hypothetical protein